MSHQPDITAALKVVQSDLVLGQTKQVLDLRAAEGHDLGRLARAQKGPDCRPDPCGLIVRFYGLAATAFEEGENADREEAERGGFGDFADGDAGDGDGTAEVVEDVGEVGEIDAAGGVEVAIGPQGGGGAEVVEDGGEVGEVDLAVSVGIAEQALGDFEVTGVVDDGPGDVVGGVDAVVAEDEVAVVGAR